MKRLIFIAVFFLVSVFSFSQIIIEAVDPAQFNITDTLQYTGYARYRDVYWEGDKWWVTRDLEAIQKLPNVKVDSIKYNSDRTKALIKNKVFEVWPLINAVFFHRKDFDGHYEVYFYNKNMGTKMFYTTRTNSNNVMDMLNE